MIKHINSNMTPREAYRQYGELPRSMLENILDACDLKDQAIGVIANIEESRGCFPSEDFMQEEIDNVASIVRGMRKSETKDKLLQCLESLEQLQSLKSNEADYGREELKKALDVLYFVEVEG